MKLKNYTIACLFLCSFSLVNCKSNKVVTEEEYVYELILLLKDDFQPKDIEGLRKYQLQQAKRTNFTLNQWYVTYNSLEANDEQLISQLGKNKLLMEVARIDKDQPLSPPENLKIKKSGKTNPIKNK